MSGVLKSIGKTLLSPISMILPKKIGKVVRKIAIGALAVGAVALTGGAALGILPSLGTMVGGLGLGAGLTSALTGAISSGAVGAVGGLLTGGFKGMTKGLLVGAATGGALGGLGVLGQNGLIGGGKAAAGAASNSLSAGPGLSSSIANATLPAATTSPALGLAAPGGGIGLSSAAASLPAAGANLAQAAGALPSVPTLAAAGTKAAGGIGGFMAQNPMMTMMAGQALTGLATPSASSEAAKAQEKEGANLFSGAYTNGGFGQGGNYSIPSNLKAASPTKRFRLNRQTMEVEEVG